MPRENAESAAKYTVPAGSETGLRGSESDHTAAGDESADDQHEEFVLSEETLSKLPPEQRAIAAVALRAQRENAELRASLAKRGDDDDDYEEDEDEQQDEEETPQILDEIPTEGYEKLAPVLKELFGGLIQENKRLHERLDRMEESGTRTSRMTEFKTFQRLHPDWKKYDEQMAGIAKRLGFVPSNVEQLEELYDWAKGKTERPSLEAEIARTRKAAPNPRLQTPSPSLRSRMTNAGNGKRSRNIREAFEENWAKVMRESPIE